MSKIRMEITKDEEVRYISHLDYASAMDRAIRRAGIPIAYSEGFNPHSKIAFASALAVGVTSAAEYMDIEVAGDCWDSVAAVAALKGQLPPGIRVQRATDIRGVAKALMAVVNLACYEVVVPMQPEADFAAVEMAVNNFNSMGQIPFVRQSPKGRKEVDIKQYLENNISVEQNIGGILLKMEIRITPGGSVKPSEVLLAMIQQFALPVLGENALIHRTGLLVVQGDLRLTPIDLLR